MSCNSVHQILQDEEDENKFSDYSITKAINISLIQNQLRIIIVENQCINSFLHWSWTIPSKI